MAYLMAIDAGTGSVRAVLFNKTGEQIAVAQQEWEHLSEEGVVNSMSFDLNKNWDLITLCIKEAIDKANIKAKDVVAISASSMREGIVLYDEDKKPIWAVANVDARAGDEVRYLKEYYPNLEEEFYQISGQTFALGALPRLLWLKRNRASIYERVAYISMISDWILAKLSGIIAVDPSNGGTSGIFSLKKRDWDRSMAKRVGIKEDIFPPTLEPGSILGRVCDEVQKSCGLSLDTLIVMGGGDVQMGTLGLGLIKEGDCAILGGSFWQQIVNINKETKPPKDMSIRINPHVVANLSQAEGITFFSGLVMRWFRDAFCDYEKEIAKERGVDVYQILDEMAKEVEVGSNSIIPIFSDRMKYSKWYHAAPSFINLSLDPNICNKASMFRSLEENAAIVSAINLQNIESFSNQKIGSLIFAGGASKSILWSQIVADVTGKELKVPKVKEATALGVAMVAGIGAGIYKDFDESVKRCVRIEKTFHPNMDNYKKYQEIAKRWQEVYEVQLSLVDRALTNSMWKAPGV